MFIIIIIMITNQTTAITYRDNDITLIIIQQDAI